MRKLKEPATLDDFDAWGRHLRAVWKRAEEQEWREESLPPLESKYGALRSSAYGYLYRLKQANLLDELQEHFELKGRFMRGPKVSAAAWVLRLLELKPSGQESSKRTRIAYELDFALRHNIDPARILGFIYEAGGQDAIIEYAQSNRKPEAVSRYSGP
jgi:hypothetical protein